MTTPTNPPTQVDAAVKATGRLLTAAEPRAHHRDLTVPAIADAIMHVAGCLHATGHALQSEATALGEAFATELGPITAGDVRNAVEAAAGYVTVATTLAEEAGTQLGKTATGGYVAPDTPPPGWLPDTATQARHAIRELAGYLAGLAARDRITLARQGAISGALIQLLDDLEQTTCHLMALASPLDPATGHHLRYASELCGSARRTLALPRALAAAHNVSTAA